MARRPSRPHYHQRMPPWTCPACARSFGRTNQSHTCAPAMPLEAYLSRQPAEHRGIYEAVIACLADLGNDLVIDAVDVGLLIKRSRTFAELRPRRDRVVLSLKLSRRLEHPRVNRTIRGTGSRVAEFIDLHSPADVDDQLCAWLLESYLDSPL